jgi:hypothetical protein
MELGRDCVEVVLDTLVEKQDLALVVHQGVHCIYLEKYHKAEQYIASKLDLLQKTASDSSAWQKVIFKVEETIIVQEGSRCIAILFP